MLYSTRKTAELLGYNDDSYIRRLILEGKLKAVKFNRQWVVDTNDIETYKKTLNKNQVKYRELFQFNEELHALISEYFDSELPRRGPKDDIVANFTTKGHKTHNALLLLCRNGFGEDAAILSRSLFEMMINLYYILNDTTDERAYRYFAFDWILQLKMFESMSTTPEVLEMIKEREKNPKKGDTNIAEIKKYAEEVMNRFHFSKNAQSWSDKDIRSMAIEIEREHAYKTAYKLLCQLSHSASRSMINYMGSDEKGNLVLEVDNPDSWVEEALVTGFDFLFHIVVAFNLQFKLGMDSRLQSLESRYADALDKK